MKILVVEDDPRIAAVIRRTLGEAGYAVDVENSAPSAMMTFDEGGHDLVLLDLMIPGAPGGGMDVCRHVRATTEDIPVLMLTALGTKRNIVAGLDAGADDYLVKPFHLVELLARVRALLRRSPRAQPSVLHACGITLDPATRTATRAGRLIDLSAKEFSVLEYLMRNAGAIISSSELIDHAWDSNYDGFSNVVQTYIRYLRKKLTGPGEDDVIRTHRGSGYSIAADQ
ncbi:MAG: response regulator transcription factor [Pseudomonas sp.]